MKSNGYWMGPRICFCGAVRADGENAEPGAAETRNIKRWWTRSSNGGGKALSPSMARRGPLRRSCVSVNFNVIRRCFPGCIRMAMFFILASRCVRLPAICCGMARCRRFLRAAKGFMEKFRLARDLLPARKRALTLLRERFLGFWRAISFNGLR